jgi:uncharacterized protein (TIGR02246 family)
MMQYIKTTLLLAAILTAIVTVGVSQEAMSVKYKTDDVRKAIEAAEAKFGSLYAAGDIKAAAEVYSEDAEALPPGSSAIGGRDAIRMFWEGAFEMGIAKVVVKTLETSGTGGDTAYEQGTYTLYGKAGDIRDDGKYIVVWRREGKAWRMYRDIWNSNRK